MAFYYADPTVLSGGDGSIEDPWSLQTALNNASQTSADTLYLRDNGIFYGRFISTLTGGLVTSYPGEWAQIDGYYTTTLPSPLSSSSANTTIDLPAYIEAPLGTVIQVDIEDMYIVDRAGTVVTVVRGWGGTTVVAHSAGAPIWQKGSTLTVNGSDTVFQGFEIFDSNPNRSFDTLADASSRKGGQGIQVFGSRTKYRNLVIHDTQDGMFLAESALDLEVYGLITYNNGHVDPNRGNGHGIYIQNNTGLKTFKNNTSFNNFATGMKGYSQGGHANNLLFENNVSFNNGSPSTFTGNPAGYASNHRFVGIYVGTSEYPLENITVTGNYLYQPAGSNNELGNLGVGWTAPNGQDVTITNNYIMGGDTALGVHGIEDNAIITGNHIFASLDIASLHNSGGVGSYTWNNNTYYDIGTPGAGGVPYSFTYNDATNRYGGGILTYDDVGNPTGKGWKQWTGFDASTTYGTSAPTGQLVAVLPNEYEIGRATIVAYNWDLSSTVPVDLSTTGLGDGQAYEIRNVQNYFAAAVASGTYDENDPIIDVTTAGLTVAMPIGSPDDFIPDSTAPQFCVYEILPGEAAAGAPGAPTGLSVDLRQSDGATGGFALAWTLNGAAETSVTVRRISSAGTVDTVLGADVTSYSPTGLTIGETYTFAVKATNASGDSEWSSTVQKVLTGLHCFGTPPSVV